MAMKFMLFRITYLKVAMYFWLFWMNRCWYDWWSCFL